MDDRAPVVHPPHVVAIIEDGEVTYSRDGTTCKACLVWKAHVLCGRTSCPLCGKQWLDGDGS